MPDGRMISRSISVNEQLAGCSLEADYLFQRCIPHLDREGRMVGNPLTVRTIAAPLRKEITDETVERCIQELAFAVGSNKRSLVVWYEVRGRRFLWFPSFSDHQTGARFNREADSRLESPLDVDATIIYGTAPELVRSSSGVGPDLVRVSKVEVEVEDKVEVKGEVEGAAAAQRGSADLQKKNFTEPQRLILALNAGQLENKALNYDLFEPVKPTHAKSLAAAREILEVVPFDFAEALILAAARDRVPDDPSDAIRSLDYYRRKVLEAYKKHQQKAQSTVPSGDRLDAMLAAMKREVA